MLLNKLRSKWSIIGIVIVLFLAGVAVLNNSVATTTSRTEPSFLTNIYNRYFEDYHQTVNVNDISQIEISINDRKKVISPKDWASIVQEFNAAKTMHVRNLEINSNIYVLFAFNNGRTLTFAIDGNVIRVSRHIGEKKVDYKAKNQQIKNTVTKIFEQN